jgi:uncharacterized membrane protein YfcA
VSVDLLLAALGLLFAGVVKGAVGFGLPMIAAPVLAGIVGPRPAVVIMSIVNFSSAVLLVARLRGVPLRSYVGLVTPITAASIVGVVVGSHLLAIASPALLSVLVGLTTIIFALISAAKVQPELPVGKRSLIGSLLGLGAGVLGGTTSVFAPPLIMYFHTLRLPKRDFLLLLNLVLGATTLVQIGSFVSLGLFSGQLLLDAAMTVVCVAIGVGIGLVIQERINQKLFNRAVILVIFLIGLNLVARAWS